MKKIKTMEIKDIQPNQGNIDIVAEVMEKEEPRTFEKFGKTGNVCNTKVKDGSGEIKLTLWNEDVEKVNVGDRIHLENGWCSEYKGEKQVSAGKFGKIKVLESSKDKTVFTNDPNLLAGNVDLENTELKGDEESAEEGMDLIEEELVE